MSALSSVLQALEGGRLAFWCPGCERAHQISTAPGGWTWNQDPAAPTFSPSVLVSYNGADAGIDGAPPARCHSFVRGGQIQFLDDCTHVLAGKTVPLVEKWAQEATNGN